MTERAVTYRCNECHAETVFSNGLCADCQLASGRAVADIVKDFYINIGVPHDDI